MARITTLTPHEIYLYGNREFRDVPTWAEQEREVTEGGAKGRWTNDLTPYLVKPMQMWSEPSVREIYLKFSPQTAKTQFAMNCLLYSICEQPGPAMYIMPTELTAKRIAERKIIPAMKATIAVARNLTRWKKDINQHSVKFENGASLIMGWATSPSILASESIRYCFLDEPAKYEETTRNEADPFELIRERTNTYSHDYKFAAFSSPNDADGPFAREIRDNSDVHYDLGAKCPTCGEVFVVKWDNIIYPSSHGSRKVNRDKTARIECIGCGAHWDDAERNIAVKNGHWIPDVEMATPRAVDFHFPSWYSPFVSISKSVVSYLKARNDPVKMIAHITQDRAEEYRDVLSAIDDTGILQNKSHYPRLVLPDDAIAITCGFDTKKSGAWYVVRAWSKTLESWLIDYGQVESYAEMEAILFLSRFKREDGTELPIWRATVDTGGGVSEDENLSKTEEIYQWYQSDRVQNFGMANGYGFVYPVKGASRTQLERVKPRKINTMRSGKKIYGGITIYFVSTDQYKELYHWRHSRRVGESQRLWLNKDTGKDYARQITAEEKRKKKTGKAFWKQIRTDNHYLDAEGYAACAADIQPDLSSIARGMERNQQNVKKPKPKKTEDRRERSKQRRYDRRTGSGGSGRW